MEQARWEQIERLFNEALKLPFAERSGYLEGACGDDTDLHEEISRLLVAEQEASGFLKESDQPRSSRNPILPLGAMVGPYRVVDILGHGGMGVVYLAERADHTFQQRVALKVNFPSPNSSLLLDRLRTERQILAGLEHPNIARLLDGGQTPDGAPFFAMDYVEGVRIDDYCDTKKLDIRERLDLFLEVCDAVRYAHQNLIVHRDLKPSNLLVTDAGTPKLLDFGIAKVLDRKNADATQTGMMPMTPQYASPEQLLGQPITTLSDVYSLGVLLHELLTGQPPVSLEGKGLAEQIVTLTEGDLPTPSSLFTNQSSPVQGEISKRATQRKSTVRGLRKALTGDLDNIILKALRRQSSRRYGSVQELAEDLRRHLAGQPVKARPESFGYVASKFIGRHRFALATAALVTLVIGVLWTQTLVQNRQISEERDRVRVERDRATEERDRAEAVTEFLTSIFEASDPGNDISSQMSAKDLLELGVERARNDLDNEPQLQMSILGTIGSVYNSLGRSDEAIPLLHESLALAETIYGERSSELVNILVPYTFSLVITRQLEEAQMLAQRAVQLIDPATDNNTQVMAYKAMGLILGELGQHDEQVQYYERGRAIEELTPNPGLEFECVHTTLTHIYKVSGEFDKAEEAALKLLEHSELADMKESGHYASGLHALANVYDDQGLPAKALELFQESFAIKKRLDPESRNLEPTAYNIGRLQTHLGRWEDARESYEFSKKISTKNNGSESMFVAISVSALGGLELFQGRPKEGLALRKQAFEATERERGPDHDWTVRRQLGLAEALYEYGDFDKAAQNIEAVVAWQTQRFGEGHANLIGAKSLQARIQRALGNQDQARVILLEISSILSDRAKDGGPTRADAGGQLATLTTLSELSGSVDQELIESLALFEQLVSSELRFQERELYAKALFRVGREEESRTQVEDLWSRGYRTRDFIRFFEQTQG